MNTTQLLDKLAASGFNRAAKAFRAFGQTTDKQHIIAEIAADCEAAIHQLPDDIYILFAQIKHLQAYDKKYECILERDLKRVLEEMTEPRPETNLLFPDEEELKEAIVLYGQAMRGDANAQFELGALYKSIGHDKWAFAWHQAAAKNGNLDALYWLGNYYYDGTITEENWQKAFECYKKAALAGHPDAMNNYADMYLRGEYVEKNEEKAYELFKKAAEKGVAEAMYTLGYMAENGIGTKKDLAESREWFIRSAHAGDVFAANRLGHEAFENGRADEAYSWYAFAAERGDMYGEYNLGLCHELGIGTPANIKKAKYWYGKAALKGDKQAQAKVKEL